MGPLWSQRSLNVEEWGRREGESIRDELFRPCSLEAGRGYRAKEREQLLEKKDKDLKPPQSPRRAITLLRPCLQPCETLSDSQLHNFAVTERSHRKTLSAWKRCAQRPLTSSHRALLSSDWRRHLPRLRTPRKASFQRNLIAQLWSENRFP